VAAITWAEATGRPLASLTATIRGCLATSIIVAVSIGIPLRCGMSYSMIGSELASAMVRKWSASASCGGRE